MGMSSCFPFVRRKQRNNLEIFLVILGLDNAGKTTTTRSIKGVSSELVAPTIGFDRIEFAIDRFNINLYDLGGGKTIRDIWETYFAEVYGVIFVVDSSAPERLEECHEVLCNLLAHPCISGKPVLLLANKRDIKDALDESELIAALQLDDLVNQYHCPCRLEYCCALLLPGKKLDKAIRDGLRWLLRYIESEITTLQSRVHADMARQAREQAIEREARKERVRLAREERERLEKLSNHKNKKMQPNNTPVSDRLHNDIGDIMTDESINIELSQVVGTTTTGDYEEQLPSISESEDKSIRFSEIPEPKLCRNSQFLPSTSLTDKQKTNNHPLACSLLNSRELMHQIQLACSIDVDFTERKINLKEDKQSLIIDENIDLESTDDDDDDDADDAKEENRPNDNTVMPLQENDTKSPTHFSIPPPFYGHQVNTKGDIVERECAKDGFLSISSPKSSTEVPEVDPDLNNNNNGNNVQCLSMTPALINPLYEKKVNKKTKNPSVSVIRLVQ
uniref:ADP-ribosylation factor-like protein 13B n=1 Tax=Trichobilharzia regenti TaxID=157069 RepID=A0AA85JM37_TRIRE|nr:unnamed protein product [Trichobilharzia regenti]